MSHLLLFWPLLRRLASLTHQLLISKNSNFTLLKQRNQTENLQYLKRPLEAATKIYFKGIKGHNLLTAQLRKDVCMSLI